MKKRWFFLAILAVCTACNNTAEIKNEADTLIDKADSLGEKVWDSGKVKMKNLKEDIKKTFDKKDSVSN